ncbi:MAG: YdcF family protein [Myxococcaceae bacterium]
MFVLLSKTLDFLLSPLSWALLLMAAALLWRRHPRRLAGLMGAAVFTLCFFSNPFVSNLLMRWTEASATSTFDARATYDAVIVLGGGLDSVASQETGQAEFNAAAERLLAGYSLLKTGQARQLLLSGGNTFPVKGVRPESFFHARQLREWGIPDAQVHLEEQSRNTYENAVESKTVSAKNSWRKLLLITSAAHMSRAEGCFRAAGLEVDTLSVDHRSTQRNGFALLPRAGNLAMTCDALRELAGRLVYRVRGYTR